MRPVLRSYSASAASLLVAWVLGSLALGLPDRPEAVLGPGHLALSADLAALVAAAALAASVGLKAGRAAIGSLALILFLPILLRLADLAARTAAGRPFDPGFDIALVPALWEVLTASVHPLAVAGATALALGGLALFCVAVAAGLLRGVAAPVPRRAAVLTLALAVAGQALTVPAGTPWRPFQPADRSVPALIQDHARRLSHAAAVHAAGRAALAVDPVAATVPDRRLAALAGRDVLVVWVESYGLAALTDPRHAPLVAGRLDSAGETLAAAGFHALSGLLESPVLGGRSWLAHGTFRAGIAQPEPPVQGLVLSSGRPSLVHAFAQAGWDTVFVGPALGRPWPEGKLWGFGRTVQRTDLGYAGPAFGWSPMPDQFVLDRVEALGLRGAGRAVYMEIALTSSHAPWTPLPPRLPQGTGADGREFGQLLGAPDYTDMAGGYARSLDYALAVTVDWLVRAVTDDALVILIGDHPALPWIAGGTDDRTVPWHVLSRDAGILDRLRDWGLVPGLRPDPAGTVLPMQDVLARFLATFSPEPHPAS